MRPKGTSEELERRRLRGMALLKQGRSMGQVARMLGVTSGAVSHWKKAYLRGGVGGLRAIPHPGPTPKLTPAEQRRLGGLLLKGARWHGYATELWTLSRVAEVILLRFGVVYEPSGVWRLLRRMGWSCQKPERRARERDEGAVAQWRKRDLPRIKKSP